jgi:hypothetical protein
MAEALIGGKAYGGTVQRGGSGPLHGITCDVDAPEADATAPVVSNVTPASGSTIAADDSVQFDVTDAGGFHSLMVYVRFPDSEQYEVIHDGTQFVPRHQRDSSRTSISGGYRYVVSRFGGWPSAPQIKIQAIDSSGNASGVDGTTTLTYTLEEAEAAAAASAAAAGECGDNAGYGNIYGGYYGDCPSDFEYRFISRLLRFTRGDTNLPLFIRIMAAYVEGEIAASERVAAEFDLETATGYTLDLIGSVLQKTRQGLPDDEYRLVLQIQVQILLSSAGTGPVLREIVRLWTEEEPDTYAESYPAHITMAATVLPTRTDYLTSMLYTAKPAGVSLTLIVSEPGVDALTADSTVDDISGILGMMDSVLDPVISPGFMGSVYSV